jgi:hypothetical protein
MLCGHTKAVGGAQALDVCSPAEIVAQHSHHDNAVVVSASPDVLLQAIHVGRVGTERTLSSHCDWMQNLSLPSPSRQT